MNDVAEWQVYEDAWAKGQSPAMDAHTFNTLFYDGARASRVVDWLGGERESAVFDTLYPLASVISQDLVNGLGDPDRFRVWCAVLRSGNGYKFDHLFEPERVKLPASLRTRFVGNLAKGAVDILGRAHARTLLVRWWYEQSLLEEEREALLQSLADAHALNSDVIRQLGPVATTMVGRMVRMGRMSGLALDEVPAIDVVSASQPGNSLAPQIGALLQSVSVNLNIVDARLRADELAGMAGGTQLRQADSSYLWKTLDRLGSTLPPEMRSLAAGLLSSDRQLLIGRADQHAPALSFPLIRLLHLRLLLDAPSLRGALDEPTDFLLPAVLSHVLKMDRVSYSPELRVWTETEKRWRARWAESAGEAMSVMFLESAVALDLSLLTRIPESSDPTPDFRSATVHGEEIIFESKGATSWETHLKQRQDALEQLGKGEGRKTKKGTRPSKKLVQPGKGRAFATTLYAAKQSEERKSLLHVVDPPFPFDEYFPEGWKDSARREHYAAVLEMAGMDNAAASWRAGQRFDSEPDSVQSFEVESPERESNAPRFFGTFLRVQDLARALRYPDLAAVKALRIFVGVHQDVFQELQANRFPPSKQVDDVRELAGRQGAEQGKAVIPLSGWLPGREFGGPARGAYSMLSDGSFLAVELA